MSTNTPSLHASLEEAADDYIDACYAEWLMDQPEAQITDGGKLVERMEQQWGWDRFVAHFTGVAQ